MSETLKDCVRKHLEAGVRPTLKGRRVVLKDVVLVRADGRETPVAEEARRLKPNINLSFWSGETERQNNRVFAYDREGQKHTVQRKAGEQVVTKLGRRFYEEAPQTEWIIHLPIVNMRNDEPFNPRYIDLTPERLRNIYGPDAPEGKLLAKLNRTRGDQESLDRLLSEYKKYFPPRQVSWWRVGIRGRGRCGAHGSGQQGAQVQHDAHGPKRRITNGGRALG